MKERIYDVIKWWLIVLMAGVVFYFVYPKYRFFERSPKFRANKITGKVEQIQYGKWVDIRRGIKH